MTAVRVRRQEGAAAARKGQKRQQRDTLSKPWANESRLLVMAVYNRTRHDFVGHLVNAVVKVLSGHIGSAERELQLLI